jgi:hypothetical protein
MADGFLVVRQLICRFDRVAGRWSTTESNDAALAGYWRQTTHIAPALAVAAQVTVPFIPVQLTLRPVPTPAELRDTVTQGLMHEALWPHNATV